MTTFILSQPAPMSAALALVSAAADDDSVRVTVDLFDPESDSDATVATFHGLMVESFDASLTGRYGPSWSLTLGREAYGSAARVSVDVSGQDPDRPIGTVRAGAGAGAAILSDYYVEFRIEE